MLGRSVLRFILGQPKRWEGRLNGAGPLLFLIFISVAAAVGWLLWN